VVRQERIDMAVTSEICSGGGCQHSIIQEASVTTGGFRFEGNAAGAAGSGTAIAQKGMESTIGDGVRVGWATGMKLPSQDDELDLSGERTGSLDSAGASDCCWASVPCACHY
jgi:hypothetical protein